MPQLYSKLSVDSSAVDNNFITELTGASSPVTLELTSVDGYSTNLIQFSNPTHVQTLTSSGSATSIHCTSDPGGCISSFGSHVHTPAIGRQMNYVDLPSNTPVRRTKSVAESDQEDVLPERGRNSSGDSNLYRKSRSPAVVGSHSTGHTYHSLVPDSDPKHNFTAGILSDRSSFLDSPESPDVYKSLPIRLSSVERDHHNPGRSNPGDFSQNTKATRGSPMLDSKGRSSEIDSEPLLQVDFIVNPRREGFSSCWRRVVFQFRSFIWRLKCFFLAYKVSTTERVVGLSGETTPSFFAPNVIRNQKYNILTLIPLVLFDEFRSFSNTFYLTAALLQFIPQLKVGPLFTCIAPLTLVLFVTILKEGYDDYQRYLRDREANSAVYEVLDTKTGELRRTAAQYIRVGHVLRLYANQRVPCDVILLRAPRPAGTTFIRTDQLDGETDWKPRRAAAATQSLLSDTDSLRVASWVVVEPPRRDIYDFVGNFCSLRPAHDDYSALEVSSTSKISLGSRSQGLTTVENRRPGVTSKTSVDTPAAAISVDDLLPGITSEKDVHKISDDMVSLVNTFEPQATARQLRSKSFSCTNVMFEPLALENTLWGSTVVTSGPVWVLVIYTGSDCRAVLNTAGKRSKIGIFDAEVNKLSKALFCILVLTAALLVTLKGLTGVWFIYFGRFILLLSTIIPISLRVNLDLAKAYYSWLISTDPKLHSTVVRNSAIPEELGQIDVLLTDKTGTLTKNEMVFKKLHIGRALFTVESISEIRAYLLSSLAQSNTDVQNPNLWVDDTISTPHIPSSTGISRRRLDLWEKLRRTLLGLAVCHNVTPIQDELSGEISFQASSPDEMALVTFASSAGLNLVSRTDSALTLMGPNNTPIEFEILFVFPFSSETKRMGCIVRHRATTGQKKEPLESEAGRILFFLKGAESVILDRLETRGAHWLQEECDNFARAGLRTLVIAMKELTTQELDVFRSIYATAQGSLRYRAEKVRAAVGSLETNMTLLGLTGVEDRLQHDIPQTLEAFRHAGILIWMLTGDKIETATCVAVSARLKTRQHSLLTLSGNSFSSPSAAQEAVESFSLGPTESVLVVDGPFIDIAIQHFPVEFISAACQAPAAICCRCSPTQKAELARLIQTITGKRVAAVGDGGNDVAMIQAANCGIGIVGKEGKQASLAADFSITQFQSLHRLLFWHGRNCYQRSAKLAHFVMHRGLIIATIQVIFSAIFFFISMGIFQGWLTVGYATYYTMLPVFSLVLDIELTESVVFMFPELYDSLRGGSAMTTKTFFSWVWTSVYQGAVIMLGAMLLFESEFLNIVSITFTSLILAELLNVASEITTWHLFMAIAELTTILIYFASMVLLPNYFNLSFIATPLFWWKVGIITLVSWLPLYCLKILLMCLQPTRDSKLTF